MHDLIAWIMSYFLVMTYIIWICYVFDDFKRVLSVSSNIDVTYTVHNINYGCPRLWS